MSEKIEVRFRLNGEDVTVLTKANRRLLDVLRDDFHLTGTKEGCSVGECGACTVIVDNKAVTSCLMLIGSCEGREVVTIEGISSPDSLSPVQRAIIEHQAIQCGFLYARVCDERDRAAEGKSQPDLRRDQNCVIGESLSLYGL